MRLMRFITSRIFQNYRRKCDLQYQICCLIFQSSAAWRISKPTARTWNLRNIQQISQQFWYLYFISLNMNRFHSIILQIPCLFNKDLLCLYYTSISMCPIKEFSLLLNHSNLTCTVQYSRYCSLICNVANCKFCSCRVYNNYFFIKFKSSKYQLVVAVTSSFSPQPRSSVSLP